MKKFFLAFQAIIIVLLLSTVAHAQGYSGDVEAEIRKLEAQQAEYLVSGRPAEMKKNWSPDLMVNSPFNVISTPATAPIQTGELAYSKYDKNIERIMLHGDVVVVMGYEVVVPTKGPKGSAYDTDQPIKRRYTNVWKRMDGKWMMIARHASNICAN